MIKKIIKYRVVSLLSLASFLFVAGGFFWSYATLMNNVTGPLILHFNDMDGITSVGNFSNILFMGILGTFIVIMNFFIALELEARDRVLGKIIAMATLLMAILLFLGFAAILNVN
jgi:hypothetical protein